MLHVYLLANPRLAEAIDYSTVVPLTGSVRSAPKPLPSSNQPHSQHLNYDQNEDIVNKPIVNNRIAILVFKHGHLLNNQPKGKHEGKGEWRRYEYEGGEAGGVGRQDKEDTYEARTKQTNFIQAKTKGAKYDAGTRRPINSRSRPRTPRARPGPSSLTTSRTRPRTPSTRSRTRWRALGTTRRD